jgi:hypothetical protein
LAIGTGTALYRGIRKRELKMKFKMYRWDNQKYIGKFEGKDWMDARRNASKITGIPVDDMITFNLNSYERILNKA